MRMKSLFHLWVLAALLAGCQARPQTTQLASAPRQIDALSNQTLVYSCPECGMDYDRPGKCTMCKVDLVATQVAYICPADDKPVEHAGKCPRCDANARVTKTAVAAKTPAPNAAPSGAPGSGSRAPGSTGSAAAGGS